MDASPGAETRERSLHIVGHRTGPADEEFVHRGRVEFVARELQDLGRVDPAIEQLEFLRLTAHDEADGEARQEPVLQRQHLVQEHRARRAGVAVIELEPAGRLLLQHGCGDRNHGRDAAAGGKRDVVLRARRFDLRVETAIWRQHVERVADLEPVCKVLRHAATGLHADADPQSIRAFGIGDRVGAALLLPIEDRAHRNMLPGHETGIPHGASSGTAKPSATASSAIAVRSAILKG